MGYLLRIYMANKKEPQKDIPTKVEKKQKQSYVNQSDVPRLTLTEVLRVPQGLWDEFGGRPASPHQLAIAIDLSPTSSTWKTLSGASVAYGLTEGGSQAEKISLTPLGRKIVAPTEDGEDQIAISEV
jgi:hypothetical protein